MGEKLDIVIVNWNSGALLRTCLASVAAAQPAESGVGKIVVVDNASTDGSLEGVQQIHPLIRIVRNDENRGFSAACNQGAGHCNADYLLFLNPDTRVFTESLRSPLRFMDSPENASVGICGICLLDGAGRVSRSCCRFPSSATFLYKSTGLDVMLPWLFRGYAMREWDHARSATVDHVMGAFYLVRRATFESLGGFDQRYFVYLEDLDFSLRARKAGWSTYFLADAFAYHIGGGSSGQARARRLFYSLRSRIQYAGKHFSAGAFLVTLAATISIEFAVRLIRGLALLSTVAIADTIRAYLLLWTEIPALVRVHASRNAQEATSRRRSILILCPYPGRIAPSQRFRFEQYLELLAEKGYRVTIEAFLSPEVMAVLYQPGHVLKKAWGVVAGFLRRFRLLFSAAGYDYVYIHREVAPLGPPILEAILLKLCHRVIYDLDDALYLREPLRTNKFVSFAKWPSKAGFIASRSWKVSVSTPFLMNWARQHSRNVVVMPTTVNSEYHRPICKRAFNGRRPVIGWTGTHTTAPYLDLIRPVLSHLDSRCDFEFRVICSVDPGFPELRNYRFVRWRLESEIEDLGAIDIGLMPLPEGEWEKGKAGFKAIQYSAVEAVPVVSSVGAGPEVVIDGQTGFVVENTTESWIRAINRLLSDPGLVTEMGRRGREFVAAHYSVDSRANEFLSLFTESD